MTQEIPININFFYTNNSIVFSTDSDFIIKHRLTIPLITKDNKAEAAVVKEINISMGSIHFKMFFNAMKKQLDDFEKKHGEIKTITQVTNIETVKNENK